jgi:uncharacterized membrane protein YphA (DoxX/SURF4 family)
VQRLFSAFPDGGPGIGLLVLRGAAGLTVIGHGVARLAGAPGATLETGSAALSIASSVAVLVGLFTPGSAMLLAATVGWLSFPTHADTLLSATAAALLIADAVAIALVGPGAFSIDARLFGRREIVIPRSPHH